jgi:L-tartrate/succinate antiporter
MADDRGDAGGAPPPPADRERRRPSGFRPNWRIVAPLAVGGLIALLPVPPGLEPHGWYYFAVFVAVILALITEPIPPGVTGLLGVTLVALLGLPFTAAQLADPAFQAPNEAIRWALAGFSNTSIWLIFGAFMFATGYEKTGLGRRLALVLVKSLGRRTLGLGYAIMLADLALAPFTPSNTGRSAGTIFPVIRNIPALYGPITDEPVRQVGAYLMWVAFSTTCVTSSMFITSLGPNLLAIEFIRRGSGVEISWTQWFFAFLPVGAVLLAVLPWLAYKFSPPGIQRGTEVVTWAGQELGRMGRMKMKEWIMAALVITAVSLWIFGSSFINPTLVVLAAISAMLLTGIMTWDDLVGNKSAWNVLFWFATLVVLADGLNRVGFAGWLGRGASGMLADQSPLVVMVSLVVVFFVMHYMFASITAHTMAVFPVFYAVGTAVPGVSPVTFGLMLGFTLGIMGVLTPYATGPAPVYYGSGFIRPRDFWKLGFIFGTIFLAALLLIGVPTLIRGS